MKVVLAATLTDSPNQVEVSQWSLSTIEMPTGAVLLDEPQVLIADKGYHSDPLVKALTAKSIKVSRKTLD